MIFRGALTLSFISLNALCLMTQRELKWKRGEKLRLKIEGLGSFGEGLTRRDECEIFVPKTAPQDEVMAEVVEVKKSRVFAKLLEVLVPSPERIEAPCKHFNDCGGCDFQHLSEEAQSAWKMRITKHWIRRSSLAPWLDKIEFDFIESEKKFNYRHRVRLQIKNSKIHFFKPHSNDLLQIDECPILVEGFFESLQAKAKELKDTRDWNQSAFQSYEIGGHKLQFDEQCFTQGNISLVPLMWNRILEDINLVESKRSALDLFCGIGNFSIPMKDHFEKVTGVESEGVSLEWARKNSDQIEWKPGRCEKVIKELYNEKAYFDYVLLDPPRLGALEVCNLLPQLRPQRITYVSCSLDTLVRDLVFLVKKGGYKIKRWSVIDLFPQTQHIESIVSLVPQ